MKEHNTITDPYLHEPKGVATANAKEVYIADGLGSGSWTNPADQLVVERLLDASSTAANQLPAGLGTPLQVEFGPAVGTGSDPVQLSAAGLLTVNEAGTYILKVSVQVGRTGATGTSLLFLRALVDGVQAGRSVAFKLGNSNNLTKFSDVTLLTLPVPGTTIKYEIIRDSTGANFGGLFQATSADGWNSSPSAALRVERLV